METAKIPQLEAANPAPELIVCTRFCLSSDLNFDIAEIGMRASDIAKSAPMIDVLALKPSLAMICIQIIAEITDMAMLSISVDGSSAFT